MGGRGELGQKIGQNGISDFGDEGRRGLTGPEILPNLGRIGVRVLAHKNKELFDDGPGPFSHNPLRSGPQKDFILDDLRGESPAAALLRGRLIKTWGELPRAHDEEGRDGRMLLPISGQLVPAVD